MNRQQPRALLATVILSALFCGGCFSTPKAEQPLFNASGEHGQIAIVYQLQPEQALLAAQEGPQATRHVSHGGRRLPPLEKDALANLLITYPHPDGRPGLALVGLIVRPKPARKAFVLPWQKEEPSRSGPQPEKYEVWLLDVPRRQVDDIVAELDRLGHLKTDTLNDSGGGAYVISRLDSRRVSRSCKPVPGLDALLRQVRAEGLLVSHWKGHGTERRFPVAPVVGHNQVERLPPVR